MSRAFLKDLITDNPIYKDNNARAAFFALGAGVALWKTISYSRAIFGPLFRFNHDLTVRYGKNSWAVITGASDGIGKGYALELARRGFNIVLVGRSQEKLDQVVLELKLASPQAQTRVVVVNFIDSYQPGFAEKILEQVIDLDVSILINNAGVYDPGLFINIPTNKITETVLTNCLAHALITRVFLPKLISRPSRSAIINTSSIVASSPKPYIVMYASSKVFHDFLSRGLAYEHPNLDILSGKPALISTKMNNYTATNYRTITVDDYVNVTLRDLGVLDQTYGHWRHRLDAFFMNNIGASIGKPYWRWRFNIKE